MGGVLNLMEDTMTDTRPTAFFVALTHRNARATAESDWGWQLIRRSDCVYRTPEGEYVRFIPDHPGASRGLGHGTPLYLGYGWEGRRDREELQSMINMGRFVVKQPVMGEHALCRS